MINAFQYDILYFWTVNIDLLSLVNLHGFTALNNE